MCEVIICFADLSLSQWFIWSLFNTRIWWDWGDHVIKACHVLTYTFKFNASIPSKCWSRICWFTSCRECVSFSAKENLEYPHVLYWSTSMKSDFLPSTICRICAVTSHNIWDHWSRSDDLDFNIAFNFLKNKIYQS